MADELARRLVPDELWEIVRPMLPQPRSRPQGGGRSRADDRAVFTAVAFVLTSNCPWRALPPVFGVKAPTVHRRFGEWVAIDLWQRLFERCQDRLGDGPEVEWTRALAAAVESRIGADLHADHGRTSPRGERAHREAPAVQVGGLTGQQVPHSRPPGAGAGQRSVSRGSVSTAEIEPTRRLDPAPGPHRADRRANR